MQHPGVMRQNAVMFLQQQPLAHFSDTANKDACFASSLTYIPWLTIHLALFPQSAFLEGFPVICVVKLHSSSVVALVVLSRISVLFTP